MGHEATVTKQRTLSKVEECLVETNKAIATTEDLRSAHNALNDHVRTTVTERLNAHGTWCERNEKAIKERPTAETMVGAIDQAKRELARALSGAARDERAMTELFIEMTFWRRLRWLLFGTLPRGTRWFEDVPTDTTTLTDGSTSPFGDPAQPWGQP
jgi:hypothetical protein